MIFTSTGVLRNFKYHKQKAYCVWSKTLWCKMVMSLSSSDFLNFHSDSKHWLDRLPSAFPFGSFFLTKKNSIHNISFRKSFILGEIFRTSLARLCFGVICIGLFDICHIRKNSIKDETLYSSLLLHIVYKCLRSCEYETWWWLPLLRCKSLTFP